MPGTVPPSDTPARRRLDIELVRRGLARSRGHAASLIRAGAVQVAGRVAAKPAAMVDHHAPLRVDPPPAAVFASRGGGKLAGALRALPELVVAGRRCLDAGASAGGFTDVLLRLGAAEVAAVDVGCGQLAAGLRADPRVRVFDRVNVRSLRPGQVGGPVELAVADLSFISLTVVLPALAACTAAGGDLLPMVKPQFEVGRARLGRDGVVGDPRLRGEAVLDVARAAHHLGLGTQAVVPSPVPGPSGNVEFFLWLRRDAPPPDPVGIHAAAGVEYRGRR